MFNSMLKYTGIREMASTFFKKLGGRPPPPKKKKKPSVPPTTFPHYKCF